MVEITVLELSFPDARLSGEAEFNAPFAGRGSSAEEPDDATESEESTSTGPTAASVVAILVGLAAVVTLVWLRGRGSGPVEEEPDD